MKNPLIHCAIYAPQSHEGNNDTGIYKAGGSLVVKFKSNIYPFNLHWPVKKNEAIM